MAAGNSEIEIEPGYTLAMNASPEDPFDDEGGDAACWAHLFEGVQGADLATMAAATSVRGPAWRLIDADLNANLLVFDSGQGIEPHVNHAVDVLIVGVAGTGSLVIDGITTSLAAGRVVLIPKGRERSIRAESDRFAYLTVHRARGGLLPTTHS
jgi:quercetin dioxygenase-like cupin family protein